MKKEGTKNPLIRRHEDADLPDLAEVYALAYRTINSLPQRFQEYTNNILVRVENFAEQDVLDGLKLKDKYDLLGLYQGIPLPLKGTNDTLAIPDIIYLYRGPLIRFARENSETLPQLVHHVMIHEIGHHFGFSDFDMEWIEQKYD
ncbi:MAG: Zn-dependent protease [Alphaproteobacteria bacterium]|jgi:predicted Zn-dependent protease with MMP-like domain|nr:Zn-dependent protease [Alphaproteobacteria bacterium]MDF3033098.1 Zn-dependent protease [Alphaproteobacteria bacterium]